MQYEVTLVEYVTDDQGDRYERRGKYDVGAGDPNKAVQEAVELCYLNPLYGPSLAPNAILVAKTINLLTKAKDLLLDSVGPIRRSSDADSDAEDAVSASGEGDALEQDDFVLRIEGINA